MKALAHAAYRTTGYATNVCMYMQLKNFMKTIADIQGPMEALALTIGVP
jgi:hypothetical protein